MSTSVGELVTLTDSLLDQTIVASTDVVDTPVTSMPLRSVGLHPSSANRTTYVPGRR
jgi:hypothetical protein